MGNVMVVPKARSYEAFRFGDFELNLPLRRLSRAGLPVPLPPKPFDLLVYLVQNRQRVVTAPELMDQVWGGTRVNDQALRYALHVLRRALGDSGRSQSVIKTIPRAGFQFVAVVRGSGRRTRALTFESSRWERGDFVERKRLIDAMDHALAAAQESERTLLLISGQAGIGKTASLERLSSYARIRGFRVLHGRSTGTDGAPAYWPWVRILRPIIDQLAADSRLRSVIRRVPEIAWILPDRNLSEMLRDRDPSEDSRSARFLIYESVTRLIEALSTVQPLAILLDDLQDADRASLSLLKHISAEITEAPICLAVAYRGYGPKAPQAFADTMAHLSRLEGAIHLPLDGLAPKELSALVTARCGVAPSEVALRNLQEKTGGNPFFALQVLHILRAEGRIEALRSNSELRLLSIPSGVRGAIRKQIDELPAETKNVLEIASVLGKLCTCGPEKAAGRV